MFWSKKGPEKLKKIPYDLVSYIAIETDAIQDNNDRQMLSSYCLNKLETVKWYLALLDAGSEKYIVPHTKSELEDIKKTAFGLPCPDFEYESFKSVQSPDP